MTLPLYSTDCSAVTSSCTSLPNIGRKLSTYVLINNFRLKLLNIIIDNECFLADLLQKTWKILTGLIYLIIFNLTDSF